MGTYLPPWTIIFQSLPKTWPGRQRAAGFTRGRGPFAKVKLWGAVERMLERELKYLGAKDVTLALDMAPTAWNMQNRPRADARARTPAVILSFTRKDGVRLTFPCDTFNDWVTNVYAITLTLEKLRAIDRYEVGTGSFQYEGLRALPAGTAETMSVEVAAELLMKYSGLPAHVILTEPTVAAVARRTALNRTHPDADAGDEAEFQRVQEAVGVIERHHA